MGEGHALTRHEMEAHHLTTTVIAGLDPAIPLRSAQQCHMNRDGRNKSGHDEGNSTTYRTQLIIPGRACARTRNARVIVAVDFRAPRLRELYRTGRTGAENCSVRSRSFMSTTVTIGAVNS